MDGHESWEQRARALAAENEELRETLAQVRKWAMLTGNPGLHPMTRSAAGQVLAILDASRAAGQSGGNP